MTDPILTHLKEVLAEHQNLTRSEATSLMGLLSEVEAKIERLTHLHNLDHSLADQRQAEIERLRDVIQYAIGLVDQPYHRTNLTQKWVERARGVLK